MDCAKIEELALDLRGQLGGRDPTEALELAQLAHPITARFGARLWSVRARLFGQLPPHVYAMTTLAPGAGSATLWLHRHAWAELPREVPRTRFSVAHELGHVSLHAVELAAMHAKIEPDHHDRLEREANRFAAHLLIPDRAFAALVASELAPDALARRFGVSAMTAGKRLAEWMGER